MRLKSVRVREFQSIRDSSEFEIDDITCLVGKNEAGKTALLKALYRLNPIFGEGDFDVTDDYPRADVSSYEDDVESGRREHATVVSATYALLPQEIEDVKDTFGPDCFKSNKPSITLNKGYANQRTFSNLRINTDKALKYLIGHAGLSSPVASELLEKSTAAAMFEHLKAAEQTDAAQALIPILKDCAEHEPAYYAYNTLLRNSLPKFLYFDEYYQMRGHANVQALKARVANEQLRESDHPLMGLLELARLDLDELLAPKRTEALVAKLEAAENQLTAKVLKYWSQNRHLRLKFDIRQAQPEDPEGMTSGMNIWGRVNDTKHMVSTPLGTRSRGFVWFFSFLAWYSQLRRKGENLILLLDEPGLSLHAKAQEDLLLYFEKELKPHHQVIYTTHSPFMVDPSHFERVRIVQDLSIDADLSELSEEELGTRVVSEVLDATEDSLFPLQGALGYEIHQTLFIGPNSLVVEGASDLLYLQTLSALLQRKGRPGLRPEWTVTPVGGSDKVPTFVALIGAKSSLNIAVLIDFQKKDKQTIENLYKRKLLQKKQVITFADFVTGDEADIEDLFNPAFYLALVNGEFGSSIAVSDLGKMSPRILQRIEDYLEANPFDEGARFNHYRPARYFAENCNKIERKLNATALNRIQELFNTLNGLL